MSRRARTCQAALERKDLPRVRSCGVHTERGAPSRLPSLWLVPTKRSAVSDAYIPRQPGPPAPPPPAAPASWWRGISQTPSPKQPPRRNRSAPTMADPAGSNKLDRMANVTRLNQRTVRILGQNPSSFTLQGTLAALTQARTRTSLCRRVTGTLRIARRSFQSCW